MALKAFQSGEWVIYSLQKFSPRPGPRAHDVIPTAHGEDYVYQVDKFWIVDEVLDAGRIRLRTRRGKTHVVSVQDINLRRPRWWERWFYATRFQAVESGTEKENNE